MRLKQDIRSLTLIPGSGGDFEITVNGETIHSKRQSRKFPDPETILKLVRERR